MIRQGFLHVCIASSLLSNAHGEGAVLFIVGPPGVRVGSENGPLAASGIYCELFAGASPDQMTDLNVKYEFSNGKIPGHLVPIPFLAEGSTGYVSFVAWDSRNGLQLSDVAGQFQVHSEISTNYLWDISRDVHSVAYFSGTVVIPTNVPEPGERPLFWGSMLLGLLFAMRGRRESDRYQ